MTDPGQDMVTELRVSLRVVGATTDDCPALYDRVAAGVRERRRRARVVAGTTLAVLVLALAAVPAVEGLTAASPSTASALGAAPVTSTPDSDTCPAAVDLPMNSYLHHLQTCARQADAQEADSTIGSIGRDQNSRLERLLP